MDESDWLACQDPATMLLCLHERGKLSDRKLRLFAVACCRRIGHLTTVEGPGVLQPVDRAERLADGAATEQGLAVPACSSPRARVPLATRALRMLEAVPMTVNEAYHIAGLAAYAEAEWLADLACRTAFPGCSIESGWTMEVERTYSETYRRTGLDADRDQTVLLRCLFGNPFRAVSFHPAWRTPDVVTLAGHIYHDRTFDQMPGLADAVEADGCTDSEILGHLRSPGPHVRGCFAVDAFLDRG